MTAADSDHAFQGSIPQMYERYMVPLLFEPYAADLASRLASRPVSRVAELPALLRVYEGAARQLTGDVDDATIVKLNRLKPQVSFLVYPGFAEVPHPVLEASIVAKLGVTAGDRVPARLRWLLDQLRTRFRR